MEGQGAATGPEVQASDTAACFEAGLGSVPAVGSGMMSIMGMAEVLRGSGSMTVVGLVRYWMGSGSVTVMMRSGDGDGRISEMG